MTDADYTEFNAHGWRWTAQPSFCVVITGDLRVMSPQGAVVVKSGPARRVWRFDADVSGRLTEVFVKEYLLPDSKDRLRFLFQPSKAWHEFEKSRRAAARGISVPEVLAVGAQRRGPLLVRSVIITRSLGGLPTLEACVSDRVATAPHREVRAFAESLARFLRRIHDAGILHEDFHAGNVLVGGEPGAPVFHLIDVADISLGAPLSFRRRVENLAVLDRFFSLVVPRHWRLRFLGMYFACGAIEPDRPGRDVAAASRRIEDTARRGLRNLWAKRDARVYGNNKYYRHVHVGALAGRARRTPEAAAALNLFECGDPFARAEMILKDSASSRVGVFAVDTPAGTRRIVIKKRKSQAGWKTLLDPFRASRAMKGFFYGAAFEHRRLPSPRVLAALDCRRLGCIDASYLVSEYLEGAESLARCLAAGKSSPLFQRINADRNAFLSGLAHTLRRMHAYGFSMRDLKAANILVYPAARGVAVSITDLDGVRMYPSGVPERRAMRDIARLYYDAVHLGSVTRRESMWFLKCYLGTSGREALSRWVSGVARNLVRIRALFAKKESAG